MIFILYRMRQQIWEQQHRARILLLVASFCVAFSAHSQTVDSFNPGGYGPYVRTMAIQPDGKVLAGGSFVALSGVSHFNIGRINLNGTTENSFNTQVDGLSAGVNCVALQTDNKILLGGSFQVINSQARTNIGRLNADGTLDTNFNTGSSDTTLKGIVYALAVQDDGKILVGGEFTTLGGQTRNRIGRLSTNGTLDLLFNPGANNLVLSIAVLPDKKILVGGTFTNLAGQTCSGIGQLNEDGTLNTNFNAGDTGSVSPIAVQTDGKILVGGVFTNLVGQSRSHIGRLNEDGTLDNSFNPGANNTVHSLALQTDGKILVGGSFTILAGQACTNIGRLNANGTLDGSFNSGSSGPVYSLVLQSNGKVLVGGQFQTLGGQSRSLIGRLTATEPTTENLTFDGSTITWLRGGTSPEAWRTTFATSTNGTNWIDLGAGVRITGGWQLTNVFLSASSTIRARGFVTGGYRNGSSWFVDSTIPRPSFIINDGSFGFFSNQFGLNISGGAGQIIVLEGSTNFSNWISLATNTLGSGPLYFADPYSTNFPQRFYRVQIP